MTYDYTCITCAHMWNEQQSIKADATTQCPKCKHNTAQRIINARGGFFMRNGDGSQQSSVEPQPTLTAHLAMMETRHCEEHGTEFRVVAHETVELSPRDEETVTDPKNLN